MERYDYNPDNDLETFSFGVLYDAFDTKTGEPVALLKVDEHWDFGKVKKDILQTLAIDEEDILFNIPAKSKKRGIYNR